MRSEWEPEDLIGCWTLDDEELALLTREICPVESSWERTRVASLTRCQDERLKT